ncbi:MAG: PQQ-binding-like beta-propeller repeat protein [Acidobacteriota bacterium]
MGQILSTVTVSKDHVFCYLAREFELILTAIEIDSGEPAWERPIGIFAAAYWAAGALQGSRLFYCDEQGLAAVDSRSGSLLTRMENSDDWLATSPPTLLGDQLFFHDHAGRLWAVDTETLEPRWNVERRGMISYAPPAVSGNGLIAQWIQARCCRIARLDLRTGECAWELERSELGRGTCTVHKGLVFVPLVHAQLILALDIETGEVVWERRFERQPEGQSMDQMGFAVDDKRLFHSLSPTRYEALDQATGDVAWRFETNNSCPFHPIVGRGWTMFVARNGTITWLASDSGQLLARFSIGKDILHAPAMTGRGLFVASDGGTLWCLRDQGLGTG